MITLSAEQEEVMQAIVRWYKLPVSQAQVFYLAGYAGTGKSTIVERAIEEIKGAYNVKDVVTAAYTGKAASVLQRKGVPNAQTIHAMLYIPGLDENGDLVFTKRFDSGAATADLIVLDECSMIGEDIANDIRELGRKILVIGDPGQLPPIDGRAGFTNVPPDRFLREIHRQSEGSPIIHLATMARKGEKLPLEYENGNVRVLPLTWETREHLFNPETQPICGTHVSRYNYTQAIRKRLGIESQTPVPGEKIICCRTNYRWGFYNGFMGTLKGIHITPEEIIDRRGAAHNVNSWRLDVKLEEMENGKNRVLVDPYLFQNHFNNGRIEPLPFNKENYGYYSEFDWAYIITCHKAQGSQYEHVTVIDDSGSFGHNRERWLYTAITRAVSGLTILTRNYR